MIECGNPLVLVYRSADLDQGGIRVAGTIPGSEPDTAMAQACEWWVMMFGSEPKYAEYHGDHSDDHWGEVGDRDSKGSIVIAMLGDLFRTDVKLKE